MRTQTLSLAKRLALVALGATLFSCAGTFPWQKGYQSTHTMKHGKLVAASNTSSAQASSASTAKLPARYQDIQYPQFQYVAPYPTDARVQISDSITGYVVSDRTLPFVKLNIYFKESTIATKPQEVAAYSLLPGMYRRGGSTLIPPATLDDSLELLAAGIGGDMGDFQSTLSLNCLSRDFAKTLGVLTDVYTKPLFDSTRLELQKSMYLQNLQHKFDRPQEMLSALSRFAYYQSSPRLWNAKPEEVSLVKQSDLQKIAQGRFATHRVIFAVSGDFDRDSMIVALKTFFAKWPSAKNPLQESQTLKLRNQPGVYIADKAITQANITMIQPFLKRPHPDYYAASVASYILGGGGFSSRLTLRVRSDEGLAYSINSFAQSDYNDLASSGVSVQTKVSSAPYAIKLTFEEIRKLGAKGPTAEELEGAKQSLIESLPGMFDSPHSTADAFAHSELWGRSPDHFRNYPAEIRKVTAADVQRCIQTYFTPEKMTISIVGPVAELLKRDEAHQAALSDFGTVRVIPVDSLEMR